MSDKPTGASAPTIVFADMDGTLLCDDKSISPGIPAMLDALVARGIPFVPCSGRSTSGIPTELLDHPATRYVVSANGSAVHGVGPTGDLELLRSIPMRVDEVLALHELVQGTSCYMDIFADGRILVERPRYDLLDTFGLDEANLAYMRRVRTPMDETIPELLAGGHVPERVTLFWDTETNHDRIRAFLDADPDLSAVSSHARNYEVTNVDATKGTALRWVCEHAGVDVARSVAFGDTSNDVAMLEAAGDGVAMANATPEAMAVADHVTVSNEGGGVARYVMGLLG